MGKAQAYFARIPVRKVQHLATSSHANWCLNISAQETWTSSSNLPAISNGSQATVTATKRAGFVLEALRHR